MEEIENDVKRVTAYYRGLGFFNARVGREIERLRWLEAVSAGVSSVKGSAQIIARFQAPPNDSGWTVGSNRGIALGSG